LLLKVNSIKNLFWRFTNTAEISIPLPSLAGNITVFCGCKFKLAKLLRPAPGLIILLEVPILLLLPNILIKSFWILLFDTLGVTGWDNPVLPIGGISSNKSKRSFEPDFGAADDGGVADCGAGAESSKSKSNKFSTPPIVVPGTPSISALASVSSADDLYIFIVFYYSYI